jgi:hypothetical protein
MPSGAVTVKEEFMPLYLDSFRFLG